MSDRAYFQALYDTAKDFTMKAFYRSILQALRHVEDSQ
jgi:hypothetical protein